MPPSRPDNVRISPLLDVLDDVRRHAQVVWLATTALGFIGAAAALLIAALLLDHFLILPASVRLLLLAAVLIVPIVVLVRLTQRRPAQSPQEIALQIEQRFSSLDNRLINCLQLADAQPEDSEGWVAAVSDEAQHAITQLTPSRAVPKRALLIAALIAVGAAGALVTHALVNRDTIANALSRMLLPLGDNTLTRITNVTPGDADRLINTDVDFAVRITGRIVTQAELELETDDGRRIVLPMSADTPSRPDRLSTTFKRLESDARYRVRAGDARSHWYTIHVHQTPVAKQITSTITPPAYLAADSTTNLGSTVQAVVGSSIKLTIHASSSLRSAKLVADDGHAIDLTLPGRNESNEAHATLAADVPRRYEIHLTSAHGFVSQPISYTIIPVTDQPPTVQFIQPTADVRVAPDAPLPLTLRATDDHALRKIQLVRVTHDGADASTPPNDDDTLQSWSVPGNSERLADHQTAIDLSMIPFTDDAPLQVRILAYDHQPNAPPGVSAILTIRPPDTADHAAGADNAHAAALLAQLIADQRTNLTAARQLRTADVDTRPIDHPPVIARQESIRTGALSLAADPAAGPTLRRSLANVAETLMIVAIEQLRAAGIASPFETTLDAAIDTQLAILNRLTRAESDLRNADSQSRPREIAEQLGDLLARQKALHHDSTNDAAPPAALSTRQRILARNAAAVRRQLLSEAEAGAGGNPQLASLYNNIHGEFDSREIRGNMIRAAAHLIAEQLDSPAAPHPAATLQQRIITDLATLIQMLRNPALAEAKEQLEDLLEQLNEAREQLDKITDTQRTVTETAQQLQTNKDKTDDREPSLDEIEELETARDEVEDLIEQLAKDLHVLPESDISNDILAELAEVYEEVDQRPGSEDNPASEVAVDRDEGLLAALKAMQEKMGERIGDLEMWLMDQPDSTKWINENFDRDELGQIPLGDLPDALEDIVGEMLDHAKEMHDQSQDSTSNNAIPDGLMGWDIADGPMPTWSAKGKSGNSPPNKNEQTGRSGSGRQGQSSGELVADTLKSLEGSDVDARRTNDPFQSGSIKEEEPGAKDAKATGGGKLAGTSNTQGMQGNAPARNELAYRQLQRQLQQQHDNLKSIYSRARLLRLPTGELDRAVLEADAALRRLTHQDGQYPTRAQKQVIRALQETQARLQGRAWISPDDASSASRTGDDGATGEPIPAQYEQAVADYMRSVAEQN